MDLAQVKEDGEWIEAEVAEGVESGGEEAQGEASVQL